jgi:phosphoribosylglycinamide formyltransferase-1
MNPSIILFASGNGSNAITIHQKGIATNTYKVTCIVCNNPKAGILQYAAMHNIPVEMITKKQFSEPAFLQIVQAYHASLLVLAGFLWMVPSYLIQAFENRIINIHPSLLPKYGGAGMYGMHVHEAVVAHKEAESGITIHLVNEEYDKGEILLQKKVDILPSDAASDVAKKVLALEHQWYWQVVVSQLEKLNDTK